MLIREKKHRLPPEFYRGFQTVAFTLCLKNRTTFFTTRERFEVFEKMLLSSAQKFSCDAQIYLFMPDHCHIILSGKEEQSDPLSAIKSFKQDTGYWLYKNVSDVHWQKDFYDHILRKDEDLPKQIRYILNNPVRKEIVNNWHDYPFRGSTVYNLDDWN
ncbi:MAG: transposase [Bacteroidetes bacterium]|nr:transposase [Bacteroidota bacterium]MBU1422660.1 transposase [Bacteroidota bacterium]MBU2636955.1 transposase [Bacteroidota bacterium]